MRKLEIPDVETFIAAIQDEISRTPQGRYYHRLHVVLHALKTRKPMRRLASTTLSTAYTMDFIASPQKAWLQPTKANGLAVQRAFCPQEQRLYQDLLRSPQNLLRPECLGWTTASYHLQNSIHIPGEQTMSEHFHRLNLTLQRPRRQSAKADPKEQETLKKIQRRIKETGIEVGRGLSPFRELQVSLYLATKDQQPRCLLSQGCSCSSKLEDWAIGNRRGSTSSETSPLLCSS